MDVGPTLDLSDLVDEDNSEGVEGDAGKVSWGRLFSLGKGLTGLGIDAHVP